MDDNMNSSKISNLDDWIFKGEQDPPSITSDWMPLEQPSIRGVTVKEIRPVAASNGYLTEIWRREWKLDDLPVEQLFQRTLEPGQVTGWHAHAMTTDRLFCVSGSARISLFDGRKSSTSFGKVWHRIIGDKRPVLIVVPPGVWHGVKALSATPALILNLVDRAYSYDVPDHWRLPPDTEFIPFKLA